MFIREQRFPISDGAIVTALRAGLADTWSTGLTVGTETPKTATRRMVTVRDDSGLAVGRVQARRQGINVWAESDVAAQNLALDAVHICQSDLPTGPVIAATSQFAGPFKIDDEVPYVVGGDNLAHYYFTFVADVKAAAV